MKANGHINVSTFEKVMSHDLTQKDKDEYLNKFLDLSEDVAQLEADRKATNERFKERIADRNSQMQKIVGALRTGSEDRVVAVEKRINWKTGKVTLRRMDTKKIFERRGLLESEKQMEIREEEAPATDEVPAEDPVTHEADPKSPAVEAAVTQVEAAAKSNGKKRGRKPKAEAAA